MALEYHSLGDLQSYIKARPCLPESEVKDISVQVLEGLKFMHDGGFAHRDLKPAVSQSLLLTAVQD